MPQKEESCVKASRVKISIRAERALCCEAEQIAIMTVKDLQVELNEIYAREREIKREVARLDTLEPDELIKEFINGRPIPEKVVSPVDPGFNPQEK